jgi:Family of unknown function (DUF6789)
LARGTGLLASAAQGTIATCAMSAVMILGNRLGLMGEQPPVTITRRGLRAAGVDRPSAPAHAIAPLGHLAFGAAGAVIYGQMRPLVERVPGALLGLAFGLVVWAMSYVGWIPALGILPAPERDRPGRPAVMVVAHVVYGLVLGWVHG